MGTKISAGLDMALKASLGINLDGGLTISLKAGPSSVVIGPDGVSITGPLVKINSGGAPGNAGKAAKAAKASPAAPKAPKKTTEKKDPLAK
jgi:type VI secretion system secreted protein VgrG